MGGINFGWLAVWVPSPDWLCRKLEVCYVVRRLGETAAPGGGERGPCPDFTLYTLAFALQLRKKHGKTSVRVKEFRRVNCPVFILYFSSIEEETSEVLRLEHSSVWC